MTPSQIIITVCLAAAPLLLGRLIGCALAYLYEAKNDWLGERYSPIAGWFYLQDWQVEQRQMIITNFWIALGALVGGCLAGAYSQVVTGWWVIYIDQFSYGPCY